MSFASASIARKSMLMLFALVLAGILSILISTVIARTVGVEEFGIYSLTVSIQAVVVLFAGFAMGTATAKYVAEAKVRDVEEAQAFAKTALVLVVVLSITCSAIYVMLAGPIGEGLYDEPKISSLIPFSALVVGSAAVYSTVFGVAQGCQRVRLLATMQVSNLALVLVSVTLLVSSFGTKGAFLAYFMAQSAVAIAALAWTNRRLLHFSSARVTLRNSTYVKRLFGFALPGVTASSVVGPIYWLGYTELALVAGFGVLGYFSVAMVFFQSLTVLPNSIVIPLIPKISELSVGEASRHIAPLVAGSLRSASIMLLPLFLGVGIFSKEIVEILYGSDYSPASESVYAMSAAAYFFALAAVLGAAIAGLGRMWLGLGINFIWAIIFLALVFFLVPAWGAAGLGTAFALSYAIHLANSFYFVQRRLRMDLRGAYLSPFVAGAFFVGGIFVLDITDLWGYAARFAMLLAVLAYIGIFERKVLSSFVRELLGSRSS